MTRFERLTPAQTRVLGCIAINQDTGHAPKVVAALIEKGYVEQGPDRVVGRDRFGEIRVPQYRVPIDVHVRWCFWCADQPDDMEDE